MATFTDPIAGYAIDSDPMDGQGWAVPSGVITALTTSAIVEVSTPVGDRAWRIIKNTAGISEVLRWTDGPSAARVNILILARRAATTIQAGILARSAGAFGERDQYSGRWRNNTGDLRLAKVVDGGSDTEITVAAHGIANIATKWCWLEVDVDGSTVRVRSWEVPGEGGPVGTRPGWQIEETDTDVPDAGFAGLHLVSVSNANAWDVAYFAVGTDGDPAPEPGPASGLPGEPSLTAEATSWDATRLEATAGDDTDEIDIRRSTTSPVTESDALVATLTPDGVAFDAGAHLDPATEYFYRPFARNAEGTTPGPEASATTFADDAVETMLSGGDPLVIPFEADPGETIAGFDALVGKIVRAAAGLDRQVDIHIEVQDGDEQVLETFNLLDVGNVDGGEERADLMLPEPVESCTVHITATIAPEA